MPPVISCHQCCSLRSGGVSCNGIDAMALIIASIPLQETPPERSEQHWWHEMTGGITHLAHEPVLRHTLVAFALMLIVIGFTEASIYAVLDFFGKPPTFAGVVVAVQGVGAIIGGITASRWVRRLGEAGTVTVGMALLALGLAVVTLTSNLWVTLAAVVVLGYGLPLTFIAFMTMLQRRTPHALMGRASAAVETVMGAPLQHRHEGNEGHRQGVAENHH